MWVSREEGGHDMRSMWKMAGLVVMGVWMANLAQGADGAAARIELGKFRVTAPESWKRTEPKSPIISYEFAVPKVEGDAQDGRMTVMAAGGGAEANIERWFGQFTQPDGKSTKERSKVEKLKVAGQQVHLVDISGTFDDKPAPRLPGVKREKYRMLGAIIETNEAMFFLKFYGPERTVDEYAKQFRQMVDGLQSN
jgi:hypothetical protein